MPRRGLDDYINDTISGADYDGGDERQAGGYVGFDIPAPASQPSEPVSTTPAQKVAVDQPSSTWQPPAQEGQWWDANVASYIPNNVAPDPTGYVMRNGSLVGQSSTSSGGGDPYAWIDETLRSVNSTDDPAYWRKVIAADPNGNGSARDYWIDRIRRGDGSALVRSGQLQKFQDGGTNQLSNRNGMADYGQFADPAAQLLERLALDRVMRLSQTPDRPNLDSYVAMLMDKEKANQARATDFAGTLRSRASDLNKTPYSSGDEAVMRAKAFDQLERRRQQTLQNQRENIYARGFAPTSGLVTDAENRTNDQFEGARTTIESDLLNNAIQEAQRRKDKAVNSNRSHSRHSAERT